MITFRKLHINDISFLDRLIYREKNYYKKFLTMGWSTNQILNQLNKQTNFSLGCFYKNLLISFVLGDLFNIEKISEYEILLLYVCKDFRNKGLGKKLIKKIEENDCLKKIYLEVSENNLEGILFYKKMNFIKIYTRKNYFLDNNKKFDAFVMSKNY